MAVEAVVAVAVVVLAVSWVAGCRYCCYCCCCWLACQHHLGRCRLVVVAAADCHRPACAASIAVAVAETGAEVDAETGAEAVVLLAGQTSFLYLYLLASCLPYSSVLSLSGPTAVKMRNVSHHQAATGQQAPSGFKNVNNLRW